MNDETDAILVDTINTKHVSLSDSVSSNQSKKPRLDFTLLFEKKVRNKFNRYFM